MSDEPVVATPSSDTPVSAPAGEPGDASAQPVKKLYYGEEEITNVAEGVEPGTKRVTTASGSFDLPAWELEACTSEKPGTESDLRNERAKYVVRQMLDLLLSLNIRVEEMGHYLQKLIYSMEKSEEAARLVAFGLKIDLYPNLEAAKLDIRLSKLDAILKS